MKTKKFILCIVSLSIFVILSQSVNATEIINKELNKDLNNVQSKHTLKEYTDEIKKLFLNIPNDVIKSLHDIVTLVWEIIAIFIGHNMLSRILARACCCWFVFPIVVLNNIVNINISGYGLIDLMKECWEGYDFEQLFELLGALSLIVLPIMYVIVFIICLITVLSEGLHFQGGIIDGIKSDLSYIYELWLKVGSFKPDNNNKSNYTFAEYVKSCDIQDYYYHTGFLSLLLLPLFFLKYKTVSNKTITNTLDGIPDRPFFNFMLKLLKLLMDFILKLFGKIPSIST